MLKDYIPAICSILSAIILIISIPLFIFNYNTNKENSADCAYFFEDYKTISRELYYKKVNGLCCHFALKDDMIVEECLEYG